LFFRPALPGPLYRSATPNVHSGWGADLPAFPVWCCSPRSTRALDEPGWLRLGPQHAKLWRRGETRRTTVSPERREVIDDTAFSQIMSNLHVIGAPVEEGSFGDEQAMRIVMLVARPAGGSARSACSIASPCCRLTGSPPPPTGPSRQCQAQSAPVVVTGIAEKLLNQPKEV
jgi:hypothetical protein